MQKQWWRRQRHCSALLCWRRDWLPRSFAGETLDDPQAVEFIFPRTWWLESLLSLDGTTFCWFADLRVCNTEEPANCVVCFCDELKKLTSVCELCLHVCSVSLTYIFSCQGINKDIEASEIELRGCILDSNRHIRKDVVSLHLAIPCVLFVRFHVIFLHNNKTRVEEKRTAKQCSKYSIPCAFLRKKRQYMDLGYILTWARSSRNQRACWQVKLF